MSFPCNGGFPSSNILRSGFDTAVNGSPGLQAGEALEFTVNFETASCCVCLNSIGAWDSRVSCGVCVSSVLCRDCVYNCVRHRLMKCPVCQCDSFARFCFEFM